MLLILIIIIIIDMFIITNEHLTIINPMKYENYSLRATYLKAAGIPNGIYTFKVFHSNKTTCESNSFNYEPFPNISTAYFHTTNMNCALLTAKPAKIHGFDALIRFS